MNHQPINQSTNQPPPILAAIRAALDEEGWTQRDLARAIGATEPQVSNWLAGRKQPAAATLQRMADALGRRWLLKIDYE